MPFPWKKVKSGRISELVNNHLHISQKRRDGSSLVVEAGFPTSLIDLFFKNRDKLRRSSRRKQRRNQPIPPPEDHDPEIVESPISSPFPAPASLLESPMPSSIPQKQPSIMRPPPNCIDEICVPESSGGDSGIGGTIEECRRGGGREINSVLIGVLEVFVVVVLAFSTKKLTVGITISTVLLLFLEYIGKRCRLFSPAYAAAISMVPIRGRLLRKKKLESEQDHALASRFPDQEIQTVESIDSTAGLEEIQPEKKTISKSISRNRLEYQEIELLEMATKREESMRGTTDSTRKSKKSRIKSKMQKIVPKKFRRSRKDAVAKDEQCDIVDESENETVSPSSSSSASDRSYREEATSCYDRRLSDVNEESYTKTEVALARRCMILCVVVLVGLIGGRLFALVLTLSWFLLFKLGQKLLPRSLKLPMISC